MTLYPEVDSATKAISHIASSLAAASSQEDLIVLRDSAERKQKELQSMVAEIDFKLAFLDRHTEEAQLLSEKQAILEHQAGLLNGLYELSCIYLSFQKP